MSNLTQTMKSRPSSGTSIITFYTCILGLFLISLVAIVFNIYGSTVGLRGYNNSIVTIPQSTTKTKTQTTTSVATVASSPYGLVVPQEPAIALPSIRTTTEEETSIDRKFYGGKGDKSHLGGFTSFDPQGVSPTLWKYMIEWLGIKSVVDVGCGRGISTSWFVLHGLKYVVCVEGSHDAITDSLLPGLTNVPESTKYELIEHDFSRGPWWPSQTVDAAWCVEFTEHVGRNFQINYYTTFRKAALIFVTHSNWGGWHHVEVHDNDWWRLRMESMGFVYSDYLTKKTKDQARKDRLRTDFLKAMNKTHIYNVAQHLWTTLQVFINPLVASLPEHAHLLAEHGCFDGTKGKECGKVGTKSETLTPLPDDFKPLILTDAMDQAWHDLIADIPLVEI